MKLTNADYQRRYRAKLLRERPEKAEQMRRLRAASAAAFVAANPDRAKKTTRNSHLKSKFGITHADYESLLSVVPGCAICGSLDPGRSNGYFCVDHDHATKRVRGLLCFNCNLGLGKFKDSAELLANAIAYLV